MRRLYQFIFVAVGVLGASSCSNDWLDREPSTAVPTDKAIGSYYDLVTAQHGMYDALQESKDYLGARMIYYGDVRADDMQATAAGKRTTDLYEMNYTAENAPNMWDVPYNVIRHANNIVKAVEKGLVKDGTKASVDDILGQALAVRALVLFDLTRVYSQPYYLTNGEGLGVPIVLTPLGYEGKLGRSSLKACYDQIITDLTEAVKILDNSPKTGYINAWSANALLSRVYLYKRDYENAFKTAANVIEKSPYKLWTNAEYVNAWTVGGNSELLFEIVNKSNDDWVDREAVGYLLSEIGYDDYVITESFYKLINENPRDVRLNLFTKPVYLNKGDKLINGVSVLGKNIYIKKFPGRADYSPTDVRVNNIPVLRLSEVYLIAAEAALLKPNPSKTDAAKYLNAIVTRADEKSKVLEDEVTLDRILKERRIELVGEGHRFFDLMRTGKTVTRYTNENDKGWHGTIPDSKSISFDNQYYRAILPIPKKECDANPLISAQQNPKY